MVEHYVVPENVRVDVLEPFIKEALAKFKNLTKEQALEIILRNVYLDQGKIEYEYCKKICNYVLKLFELKD